MPLDVRFIVRITLSRFIYCLCIRKYSFRLSWKSTEHRKRVAHVNWSTKSSSDLLTDTLGVTRNVNPESEQRAMNQTFDADRYTAFIEFWLSFARVFKTIAFDLRSAFVRSKYKLFETNNLRIGLRPGAVPSPADVASATYRDLGVCCET